MSCISGAKVVKSGSVAHLDISNTQKSWKGAPTTNLISNFNLVVYSGSPSTINNSYSLIAPDKSKGWSSITNTGCTTNYRIAQFPYISLTSGLTYTASIELYNPSPLGLSIFLDGTAGLTYTNIPYGYSKWVYTFTANGGWAENVFFGTYGQATSVTYSPARTIYYKNLQIEQNSFATPFVNGTRSNTQSMFDLSGKNTVTANSLTYNSDGGISFNGTSNKITINCAASTVRSYNASIEFVVKLPVYSGGQRCILSYRAQGGGSLYIGKNSGGIFTYYDSLTTAGYTAGNIPDNTTAHVVIVLNSTAGTRSHYINGVLVGTQTGQSGWSTAYNNTVTLGYDPGGTNEYMLGNLYKYVHYNRVLTSSEIKQNFEAIRSRYKI